MSDPETNRRLAALEAAMANIKSHEHAQVGVWTPFLTGSGAGGDYVTSPQVGSYTRWGRIVFASFVLFVSSFTAAPAGTLRVAQLPFAARNSNPQGFCLIGFTSAAYATVFRAVVPIGQTYIDFYTAAGGGVLASTIALNADLQGMAIYETA